MSVSSIHNASAPAVVSSPSISFPGASPTADADDSDDGLDIHRDELLASEDWLHDSDTVIHTRKDADNRAPSFASRFLALRNGFGTPTGSSTGDAIHTPPSTESDRSANIPQRKDDMDWYAEGSGRRVGGYDNLTAIDWIYEYAKERTRLRHLAATSHGLLGHLKRAADASQVWWILVATGIAVGSIAAGIDVASDWMGDLKQGICSNVADGGKFYLSRPFCCWGTNSYTECADWRPWSRMLGIENAGGSYIIEYTAFVLLSVLFATLASFLVNRYSPYAKQSGIPEIKTLLGGFVIRRFLSAWTLLIKSLGLCLAVASGMWLGKEGPLVHVACCSANLFMRAFPALHANEARQRETLSAAAASGISVAFGSPIGGVLFSLEQLSSYFPDKTMWASFVCAMVAAVTLQAFDPFRTGKLVLYHVTYHSSWHAFELLPFALIGILGGLYGATFIALNMRIARLRSSPSYPLHTHPILEVALIALLTALLSFPITFLRAQSSELVAYLFAECRDIADDYLGLCRAGRANTGVIFILLLSALLGFVLSTITFGLQIPAGILLPSMAVGALYGRVVGLVVEVWQREYPSFLAFNSCEPDIPCVTPGTYAVIGAASALAGTTRMTVSIVVIMFELTGALSYVLPIMIAVMLSKWTGDAFGKRGIYESWIQFQGYPFIDNKDDTPVPDVPVHQIMTRHEDLICITASGHTVESLRTLLLSHKYRGFPVIVSASQPVLLGYIPRSELGFALSALALEPSTPCYFQHSPTTSSSENLDLRPWMDQTPITLNSRSSFQLTKDMFEKLGLRYVLFTERGELRGLLTKKDLWGVLNEGEELQGRGVLRERDEEVEEDEGLLGEGEEGRERSGVRGGEG